jgi:transcriptional regulator with XRE-family HTH domain
MDTTQERIGESVRALSAAFEDQQTDLAKVLGVTQVSVSRKLRGQTKWSLADVDALAAHYGVSVDQVLSGPRAWLGLVDGEGGGATKRYQPNDLPQMAA